MSGYIPGVPLSSQTLAQTQQPINTNFTVINTNFGVDHVDMTNAAPAVGNGGRHNKVTLIQQSGDPSSVAAADILYTKASATKTELFMRRSTGDGSTVIQLTNFSGDPVIGAIGQTFLPGGLIMKFGISASGADNTLITFAVAFPTSIFGVQVTPIRNGGAISSACNVSTVGLSSFIFRTTSGSTTGFYWTAIGN